MVLPAFSGGVGLWLVRHPPLPDAAGLCYGRTDLPAPETLIAAGTEALASFFANAGVENALQVWSSPLQRCSRLAARMRSAHPERFSLASEDARLSEMDFGTWEGVAWDTIARPQVDAWAADPWNYRPGGAESAREVMRRWQDFLGECVQAHLPCLQHGGGVVVTHAGIIRMALLNAGVLGEQDMWLHRVEHAKPIWLPVELQQS